MSGQTGSKCEEWVMGLEKDLPERGKGCNTAWMRSQSLSASLQQQIGGLQVQNHPMKLILCGTDVRISHRAAADDKKASTYLAHG